MPCHFGIANTVAVELLVVMHGELLEAANIPGGHRNPSSAVVVVLDGFSLAAIAAQLGIALYLTGAQNSNG